MLLQKLIRAGAPLAVIAEFSFRAGGMKMSATSRASGA